MSDKHIRPHPFTLAAPVHERHAAWLLEQRKDPSEALEKGFGMVEQALKRNPNFAAAFATRGDLYRVKANATKKQEERQKFAQLAKEAFGEALRRNKYLARETETTRNEVDRMLARASVEH